MQMHSVLNPALAAAAMLAAGCVPRSAVNNVAALSADSAEIAAIEQRREDASISGDVTFLERLYSPSFRFTHFGGRSESREEVLSAMRERLRSGVVPAVRTLSRKIDSLNVEVHGDVALTSGRIHVRREGGDPSQREYVVRYVRVYGRSKDGWQLLTHRTVGETRSPVRSP